MNITSAQYVSVLLPDNTTQNSSVKATIDGVEVFVPISNGNRHYAAILEWAEEDGNEIQAAE
tara:strand:+ start:411 stop:596 length:186 start_codon:yes stop_codon:yes gene_type:complete